MLCLGAYEKDRNPSLMAHRVGDTPQNQIGQSAMTMCAHRNQVALLALGSVDNFRGWVSGGEYGTHLETLRLQLFYAAVEIGAVAAHFVRLAEIILVASLKSIRNMDQC